MYDFQFIFNLSSAERECDWDKQSGKKKPDPMENDEVRRVLADYFEAYNKWSQIMCIKLALSDGIRRTISHKSPFISIAE